MAEATPDGALSVAQSVSAVAAGEDRAEPGESVLGPRRRFAESLVSSLRHLRRPDVSKQAFLDEALAAADEYAAALIEAQMRGPYAVRPASRAPGGAR